MPRTSVGEFEHQVMLAALRLPDGAYVATIVIELEERTRRTVSPAAVHIALARLEESGLIRSQLRQSDGPGGRRERRFVTVSAAGIRALRLERERLLRLWDGIEPQLERA